MAAETEKRRLLKQMKLLLDQIESKKQKEIGHASSASCSTETQRQQTISHQSSSGSSRLHDLGPLHSCLPQQKHVQLIQRELDLNNAASPIRVVSFRGNLKLAQQQAASSLCNEKHDLERKSTSQVLDVSSSGPRESQQVHPEKGVVYRRIVASAQRVPSCKGNKGISTAQAIQVEVVPMTGRDMKSTGEPLSKMTGKMLPEHKLDKSNTRILSESAHSLNLQKTQHVAHKAEGHQKKVSVDQGKPSAYVGHHGAKFKQDTKSQLKTQLIIRNAEVIAAKEVMKNNIESLKSQLADLTAARKRRKRETRNKPVHLDTQLHSVNSQQLLLCDENGSDKLKVNPVTEGKKSTISMAAFDNNKESKMVTSKSDCAVPVHEHFELSDKLLREQVSVKSRTRKELTQSSVNLLENRSVLQAVSSKFSASPVPEKIEIVETSEHTNRPICSSSSVVKIESSKHPPILSCTSPSKSAARADFAKELKAAEKKMSEVLKKIGGMLTASPQKSSRCELSVTSPQRGQHLAVMNTGNAISYSSPSPSDVKHRSQTKGGSLRWAYKKSPGRRSGDRIRMQSVLSTLQSYQKSKLMASSSESNSLKSGKNVVAHTTTRTLRNTPKNRKSRYKLVRNDSAPGTGYAGKSNQVRVSSAQKRHTQKSFISRYKLQKVGIPNKTGNISASLPERPVFHSRYKLIKHGSHSQTSTSGYAAQLTPVQKVAKVIKGKYKMRKVTFLSPAVQNAVGVKPNRYRTNHHMAARGYLNCTPRAWNHQAGRLHRRQLLNSYSHGNSPFFPVNAVRGQRGQRGYNLHRQRMYNLHGQRRYNQGYHYRSLGGRGFSPNRSSGGWWMQQERINRFFQQQLSRRKAKAIVNQAWRMQWIHSQSQRGRTTYYPWQRTAYEIKRNQLQKRLLLKRLLLRKKYSNFRSQSYMSFSRESSPTKNKGHIQKQEHLVMINGILYKSSSSHLTKAATSLPLRTKASSSSTVAAKPRSSDKFTTPVANTSASYKLNNSVVIKSVKRHKMQTVTVRGVSFRVDARGTKLQRVTDSTKTGKTALMSRVDVGGTTYVQTKDGVYEKILDSQTRSHINRVKQRSISLAMHKSKKSGNQKKNCLFFSRFGKCSRGEKCPFLHDPEKVAVCTRFLRGTCQDENCLFSHKVSKEKMPVCAFFLKGVCTRDPCPYLHVKVNHGAEVCQDFASGYCPLAEKCPKLHTLICPHFAKTGSCPNGKKCRLQHRQMKIPKKHRVKSTASSTQQNSAKGVHHSATKTTAQSEETKETEEGHMPPRKCARLDFSGQPKQDAQDSCSQIDKPEEHSMSTSQDGDSRKSSERTKKPFPRKPGKLPAFISLADISMDESPECSAKISKHQKISKQNEGTSLQIKPHI